MNQSDIMLMCGIAAFFFISIKGDPVGQISTPEQSSLLDKSNLPGSSSSSGPSSPPEQSDPPVQSPPLEQSSSLEKCSLLEQSSSSGLSSSSEESSSSGPSCPLASSTILEKSSPLNQNVECPICFGKTLTVSMDCVHKLCNQCAKGLKYHNDLKCPLCRKPTSFHGITNTSDYPYINGTENFTPLEELFHLRDGIKYGDVTNEELCARYFLLLPGQYPDKEMLIDIKKHESYYKRYDWIWDKDIPSLLDSKSLMKAVDDIIRKKYSIRVMETFEREILSNYFERKGYDVDLFMHLRDIYYFV